MMKAYKIGAGYHVSGNRPATLVRTFAKTLHTVRVVGNDHVVLFDINDLLRSGVIGKKWMPPSCWRVSIDDARDRLWVPTNCATGELATEDAVVSACTDGEFIEALVVMLQAKKFHEAAGRIARTWLRLWA
jgi:hypothetical protein